RCCRGHTLRVPWLVPPVCGTGHHSRTAPSEELKDYPISLLQSRFLCRFPAPFRITSIEPRRSQRAGAGLPGCRAPTRVRVRGRVLFSSGRPGARQPGDEGDAMHQVPLPSAPGPYVLATGEPAAYRLRLLHNLYGRGTGRLLLEAGLRPGMRVADLGCGV